MLPHFDGSYSTFKSKQTLLQQTTSLMLTHIRRTLMDGLLPAFHQSDAKNQRFFLCCHLPSTKTYASMPKRVLRYDSLAASRHPIPPRRRKAAPPSLCSMRAAEPANDRDPQIPNFDEKSSKSVHCRLLTSFDEFPLFIKASRL